MELSWKREKLILKEPFTISYGSYTRRESLIVRLSHNAIQGFGECVLIDYYGISLDAFEQKLQNVKVIIETLDVKHPKEFYAIISATITDSFLLSALDCAYWDLYGKLQQKSFAELNGLGLKMPESTLTISIAPEDVQMQAMAGSSWNSFKVKFDTFDLKHILNLLESGKNIAIDANTTFSREDCAQLEQISAARELLYIEQPQPVGKYDVLNKNSNVLWMADEDFQNQKDLERLQPYYSAVNLKLMKCGGLTPALEQISAAKRLGLKVMIGCMTESSVGISAGIAVAALCDFADLDGANLISNDFARGSFVENGRLVRSENPGLGIEYPNF